MLARRLALTERRIAHLQYHVEQQRSVIGGLEAAGRGKTETAEIAREVLDTMVQNLRREITHRKWLRRQPRPPAAEV